MKIDSLKVVIFLCICFFVNSVPVLANSDDWKNAYINYINQDFSPYGYAGYSLIDINDDGIPELYMSGNSAPSGEIICTYGNSKITELYCSLCGISYVKGENLLNTSGGRMDVYYDYIYKVENGEFVQVHKGDYGAEDNSKVKYDKDGNPIYVYTWDNKSVTESQYDELLNDYYNKYNPVYAYNDICDKNEIINKINNYRNTFYNLSNTSESEIPNSAVEYDSHYYYIYDEQDISTYEKAIQFCNNKGGHLATLTSKEENDFVFNYMKERGYSNAYFGLSDSSNEGVWKWCNGEPVSYMNWHRGEPNAENENEDYAMFYYKFSDGTWNDGDFGNSTVNSGSAFICEWDSVSENNSRETEISVILDGNTLSFEQQPTIIKGISGGRVMVPLRDIFEAMGANVKWNSENKTITAVKGEITVQMTIDSNVMTKNGVKITLDVPAQLVSGYTMIPVRAIAEAFGSNVDWNSTSKIVNIDTSSKINALIVTADNDLTGYDAGTFNEIMLNNKIAKVDESNIHTVTEPTKETFATFVNQLIVQAGENDITYFLYSGHGGISGMNKDLHPGEDAFISPYYSHTSGHDDISDENHYTITMKELIDDYLDNIPGTVVIILHSCYSGEMNQRDFGLNKDKFKIITSCSEDQTSEMEKVGLLTKGRFTDGRFMNALIKGLGVYESDNLIEKYYYKYDGEVKADYNNDRNVTLSELYKYIYENMNKEFKGDDGMKYYQTPTVSDENDETVIYSY